MLAFESNPLPITESESATRTVDSLRPIADRVADTAADTAETVRQAIANFYSQISGKTEETAGSISRSVGNGWNATQNTAQSALDRASEIKETAVGGLDFAGDRAVRLARAILATLADPLSDNLQIWFDSHPLWQWFWHHPFVFLSLVLLGLFLLLGLLQAMADLSKKIVIGLLKLPVKLLSFGFRLATRSRLPSAVDLPFSSPDKRLEKLADRLEVLRDEERQILREISAELKGRKNQHFSLENRLTVEDRRP
ncbi:MAG: hypothetical protein ACP5D7_23305 [Limnospira sp.]